MSFVRNLFGRSTKGFQKMKHEDLESGHKGGDTLVKGGAKREKVPTRELLRFIKPLLWPENRPQERAYMVLSLVFLVASRVVSVLTPLALKAAVDALAEPRFPTDALWLYVGARVGKSLFDQARSAVFGLVSLWATRKAAVETFEHVHGLSLRFHLHRQTGAVMRSMDRGAAAVTQVLQYLVFNLVPTFVELALIIFIVLGKFDYRYALVILLMLALYVGFTYKVTEWRTKLRRSMNDLQNEANNKATDSLLNFETVKCFTSERFEVKRYDNAFRQYNKQSVVVTATLSLLNFGQQFLLGVGMLICLIMMAHELTADVGVEERKYTVGDFVMLNAYILQVAQPLFFLGSAWRFVKNAMVDLENLVQLTNEKPDLVDEPNADRLNCDKGDVEFRDVKFGYESDRQVLKGVSFHIPPGKSLAIVGSTGSGKSTISRLLLRYYDVDEGLVLVDGQNVKRVTQRSLRECISVVPQNTVLFNDTIMYNIRYGNRQATDEEVYAAAKAASLHDFVIGLPQGYDTLCGERGLRLSGGELQRVAIARALVKDPKIVILDEATSALDTKTEREIKEAIDRAAQGRTSLIIAHRLSTVVDCNEIIVLQNGLIVERGSHPELVAKGGVYATLWKQQKEEIKKEKKAAMMVKSLEEGVPPPSDDEGDNDDDDENNDDNTNGGETGKSNDTKLLDIDI